MARIKKPLRTFSPDESGDTAMTLAELRHATGESDRGLRDKLLKGRFKGAYRTNGGNGDWRIPLRSLRHYQKSNAIA
ncbi:hypothetical protein SAMN02745166_01055 [Prosthecobacter debontii]|uniref:Helix-turn-helix domain-containing protein n=1 Tax=Prosthecobacter debontii TaxID=48467 RepID=A0A1T4X5N7_9BACT|nr:hypothetical protein [Prosthecobacter debontii]SKA84747.1 hypothetical protein SAMN02745166_01055 [Prosthecobacter debontii]